MTTLSPREEREKLISNFLEIEITGSDDFLKIRETLTRMGIVNTKTKTVYQSCHILHRRGRYYIVHFKQMFALDGKPTDISDEDLERRDAIANLLSQWGLCKILNKDIMKGKEFDPNLVFILPHSKKREYELVAKYSIGAK